MVHCIKEHVGWYEFGFIPVENLLPDSISFSKRDYIWIYPKIRNLLLNAQVKVVDGMMHVLARNVTRYEVRSKNLQLLAAKVCDNVIIYELSFLEIVESEEMFRWNNHTFRNNKVYGITYDEEELYNEIHDLVTTFAPDYKIGDREVAEFLKALHELVRRE